MTLDLWITENAVIVYSWSMWTYIYTCILTISGVLSPLTPVGGWVDSGPLTIWGWYIWSLQNNTGTDFYISESRTDKYIWHIIMITRERRAHEYCNKSTMYYHYINYDRLGQIIFTLRQWHILMIWFTVTGKLYCCVLNQSAVLHWNKFVYPMNVMTT